ncbi:MAG: arginine--tRNA ligase [Thermoproteota archaeon]|nr:arginine--tRNA ligase [Thermoproteota archaeon]
MTFQRFKDQIDDVMRDSLKNMGYEGQEYELLEPTKKEFGDITCNVAFLLGKKLKKSPYEIASTIVKNYLKASIEKQQPSFIASVEAHAVGYINFAVDCVELGGITLKTVLQDKNYGFVDIGRGKKVIVEHTSVNPNKALHVGHMRNVILGDTLARLLKLTNHSVIVLNYVDDSGLQIADVLVAFLYAKIPQEPQSKFIKFDKYCGNEVYVKVNRLYKSDSSLLERRKLVLQALEKIDESISAFASKITLKVLQEQLNTCWRLRARYDLLNFESHILYSRLWDQVFQMLAPTGTIEYRTGGKNLGCWVFTSHVESNEKVIVRSDGTATYIAKDITYATLKVGIVQDPFRYYIFSNQWDGTNLWATTIRENVAEITHVERSVQSSYINDNVSNRKNFFPADIAITLIDNRQERLQRILREIIDKMENKVHSYFPLSYGPVTLSSQTASQLGVNIEENKNSVSMSGRKGITVDADSVLDALHSKAKQEAKERNPSFSDYDLAEIAEELAISAMRYNLIKYDIEKIMKFDIQDSLSLNGDSGPYIQYTHARLARLIEKSGYSELADRSSNDFMLEVADLLNQEIECELLKQISRFEMIVRDAVENFDPKIVARYLHSLATIFNVYYEKIPIVKEPDHRIRDARISLVRGIKITLINGLRALGITPLERM